MDTHSTLLSVLRSTTVRLSPIAGECAQYEATCIIEHVLGISRHEILFQNRKKISFRQKSAIDVIAAKRCSGTPLAYILGSVYFYNTCLDISRGLLIPRSETEVLVDTILNKEKADCIFFLDMGTGSGNISAALCAARLTWRAVVSDLSNAAVKTAKHNCPNNTNHVCCDRLEAFGPKAQFDFIVSNPPYISAKDMKDLDRNILDYEPKNALYGGEDGMDFYRYLAAEAGKHLKKGGRIYCEIGMRQGEIATKLFLSKNWKNVQVYPDLANRPRIVCACC